MLKMLMDPMGGIVMTNDGNAILREIEVQHPAAKNMIEISRTQDEEVGDGTTSVIILAGEVMQCAKPFIERNIHPSIICQAFYKAMGDALDVIKEVAVPLNMKDNKAITLAMWACIGTKFAARWGTLVVDMAVQAVRVVMRGDPNVGKLAADLKRYARVEKIPGGGLEDSKVLNGVMVNKDVTHSGMRRYIKNPRVLLLDRPLEYKKGESKTDIEMRTAKDKQGILQEEVNEIASMCAAILKHKPDVIITEKGVSDLA
jgi:T-complex protein 1 subunit gamma